MTINELEDKIIGALYAARKTNEIAFERGIINSSQFDYCDIILNQFCRRIEAEKIVDSILNRRFGNPDI